MKIIITVLYLKILIIYLSNILNLYQFIYIYNPKL